MSKLITGLILSGLFICYAWSCDDDYMTVEQRVIDSNNKVPVYFYAQAQQTSIDTWRPVFTYLIYSLDEGNYDAYFHAYMISDSDSVLWSGVKHIEIEGGKKIWGEYVTSAEFYAYMMPDIHPMAYVSVEYE